MRQFLGFKSVLISSKLVILILALVVSSYISIQQLKEIVTENINSKISIAANYEAKNIESNIRKSTYPIAGLGSLYEKYQYSDLHEKLLEITVAVSEANKITLGFTDGSSYSSRPSESFPEGIGRKDLFDPRTRPWFTLGRNASGLDMTDVFFTKENVPIAVAVFPIKEGVLVSDVRLGTLQTIVEGIDILPGTLSLVVDGTGMILASTDETIKIQSQLETIDGFAQVNSSILSEKTTFNELSVEGKGKLVVSTEIQVVGDTRWYLINAVDKKIAFAPVVKNSQELLLSAIIIIVISVLALFVVINRVYRPVLELKKIVLSLSNGDGDLTQRLEVRSKDDLGEIAIGINKFIDNLNTMMLDVKEYAEHLVTRVSTLRANAEKNSSILNDHHLETNMVVVAMDELGSTSEMVAQNALDAAHLTQEANQSSEQSKQTIIDAQGSLGQLTEEIDGAMTKVNKMSEETKDIGSILTVIGAIAEQTNLLALNAAIEAARAGEQGRGFAVVADEVRALAGRTQQSTREIDQSLAQLQNGASSVVSSIDSTKDTSENTVTKAGAIAESLESMTGYVTKINEISTQISVSANEQNSVIQEISQNMNRIHGMVENLTSNGTVIHDEVDDITKINTQLSELVGRFKLVQK